MVMQVMPPDQVYRGMTYKDLIEEWWNWAYSEDPTPSNETDPIFLIGNIGTPKVNLSSDTARSIASLNDIFELKQPINITTDSAVFFPVYNTLFLINDEYLGRDLKSLEECKKSARTEFSSMSKVWATYSYQSSGHNNKKPKVIVAGGLWKNYVESSITLVGSKNNKMDRESKYKLEDEEPHEGADVGIYLLMKKFAPGTYTLDFGGISIKNNFFTRAVYNLNVHKASPTVKKIRESNVSDISADMTKI